MHGHTPHEMSTGQTPDISEYTEFSFYEMLWYNDEMAFFPEDRRKLGRWLGVAHRIHQALCYYLLNINAQIIVLSTVQKIPQDKLQTQVNIKSQLFLAVRVIRHCHCCCCSGHGWSNGHPSVFDHRAQSLPPLPLPSAPLPLLPSSFFSKCYLPWQRLS
jgi:hypothetical protein